MASGKIWCGRCISLLFAMAIVIAAVRVEAIAAEHKVAGAKSRAKTQTKANTKPKEKPSSSETKDITGLGLKDSVKGSKSPLFVKSDSLSVDSQGRTFTYRGNVKATRDDLIITSDKMIGRYDDNNRIQTITGEGDVVIVRGEALRATSNRAVYDLEKSIIELTEGPELDRQGNVLSADKVTIYVDEDRSEAEGNVQVKVIKSEQSLESKKSTGKPPKKTLKAN